MSLERCCSASLCVTGLAELVGLAFTPLWGFLPVYQLPPLAAVVQKGFLVVGLV